MAGEGTEEGIPRPSWIRDLDERESSAAEEIVVRPRQAEFRMQGTFGMFGKEDGAEFSELNDHVRRAFRVAFAAHFRVGL